LSQILDTPSAREIPSDWYALYTRHQHEKNVALSLSDKGFEVFLPLYTAVHRWKDRDKRLSLPLFPCYVFLQNPTERWQSILATPGVYSLVGFAKRRATISSEEIDAVKRVVGSCLKLEPHPFLQCGDRVRLRAGPLESLEGLLVRKKSVWKLAVWVEMLERSVGPRSMQLWKNESPHRSAEVALGFLGAGARAQAIVSPITFLPR
jgi:transcription antitermination factor NusG